MHAGAASTSRVVVGGGRAVLIGPLHPNDRERWLAGMQRASAESLYKRFMTPVPRLTTPQIAYLVGIDHRDHEALLAVDEDGGEAVAIGRFVRSEQAPAVAEAAILVVDDWHGLGLGKALSRALAERARELGIERFEATMLSDNLPMLAVLRSLGEVRTLASDDAALSVEVDLPDPPPDTGERLRGILRAAREDAFELEDPTA